MLWRGTDGRWICCVSKQRLSSLHISVCSTATYGNVELKCPFRSTCTLNSKSFLWLKDQFWKSMIKNQCFYPTKSKVLITVWTKNYSMKMVVVNRKTYVYKKTPIIGDKYAIAFLRAHLWTKLCNLVAVGFQAHKLYNLNFMEKIWKLKVSKAFMHENYFIILCSYINVNTGWTDTYWRVWKVIYRWFEIEPNH